MHMCQVRRGTVYVVGIILLGVLAGFADWDPPDGGKWVQLPDGTENGIDISVNSQPGAQRICADDFLCTNAARISSIHLWVSHYKDQFVEITNLIVRIYASDVLGHPGLLLWQRELGPGDFSERLYATIPPGEWWWDPWTEHSLEPKSDQILWQINITNHPSVAFVQQGSPETPIKYWLAVEAQVSPQSDPVGWKTTDPNQTPHQLMDAMYFDPQFPVWRELRYPDGHPHHGLPNNSIDLSFVLEESRLESDLGDAPDSSNSSGFTMRTYPTSVVASFPTVYRAGSPPYGPIHWRSTAVAYLGAAVSSENDADLLPDADGTTNIHPPAEIADQDGKDDGVSFPLVLPHCRPTTLDFTVTAVQTGILLYVNIWFDWNRDGDWDDTVSCPSGSVPEWAVQNFPIVFAAPGTYQLATPPFKAWHGVPTKELWMRVTLSETPWESHQGQRGGDGPSTGYEFGETEDYYLTEYLTGDEEAELCAKWSQPPDCAYGLDVQAWYDWEGPNPDAFRAADDWRCDGRPVVGLRWWGSYIGYMGDPTNLPSELRPVAFELTWYKDVPAGTNAPWSMPGAVVTNLVVNVGPFGVTNLPAGMVSERYYCTTDLTWAQPALPFPFEHEYEYCIVLQEQWLEKENQVYWLEIRARYNEQGPRPMRPWGWKTTHWQRNWNDDAVLPAPSPGLEWMEMRYPPATWPWYSITNHPYAGKSVNMAFELLTDVCPRRAKKWWRQQPDMRLGINAASFVPEDEQGEAAWPVRADDFVSDGRRITDVHWWGSYIGWRANVPEPVQPPSDATQRLVGFWLNWHADSPAGGLQPYSMPSNPPLRSVFVPIERCHETYYGAVPQPWLGPGYWEHEFQYYVDLLDQRISGFGAWNEQSNTVYWLSIQAVLPAGWRPGGQGFESHQGWGWKTTDPSNHWEDVSVVSTNRMSGQPEWVPAEFPTNHPWGAEHSPMDLAFELTTDQVGTNANYTPIRFTAIGLDGSGGVIMESLGDWGTGAQYLQRSTNLVVKEWVDVVTNALPQWPPYTNYWFWPAPVRSNEFFRILQR
ncbi:MAG: DUF7901 domain-containing protein [Kiritimatiellia bacterium]